MSAATATVRSRRSAGPARTACAGPCAGLCTDEGFAAAHREHRPRLLNRAAAMLGDHELAEDAVQEVFVRAWGACASFDPAGGPPLVAWLTTITRNVVIDFARARAVRPRLQHSAPADSDAAPEGAGSTPMDRALNRMLLLDALAEVSAEHRGIVLRTVVHDRSYADVAAELGVPVGTVKSRVFYALRDIRGHLGDHVR